jgi:hypothetical protein
MSRPKRLTSGALARLLEVDHKTVLNWTRSGHLSAPERTLKGQARFDPAVVRDDYARVKRELPVPFAAYLDSGELTETPTESARKLPTKVLRAELVRREAQRAE